MTTIKLLMAYNTLNLVFLCIASYKIRQLEDRLTEVEVEIRKTHTI